MCIPANFELLCQATAEEQRQIGQYINHMAASIKYILYLFDFKRKNK